MGCFCLLRVEFCERRIPLQRACRFPGVVSLARVACPLHQVLRVRTTTCLDNALDLKQASRHLFSIGVEGGGYNRGRSRENQFISQRTFSSRDAGFSSNSSDLRARMDSSPKKRKLEDRSRTVRQLADILLATAVSPRPAAKKAVTVTAAAAVTAAMRDERSVQRRPR